MKRSNQTTALLMGAGFHRLPEAPAPAQKRALSEPRIENDGRGWYTVHGGEHGPCQRFGRASAEATLSAVIAARGAR